jgi:hypothetical protein
VSEVVPEVDLEEDFFFDRLGAIVWCDDDVGEMGVIKKKTDNVVHILTSSTTNSLAHGMPTTVSCCDRSPLRRVSCFGVEYNIDGFVRKPMWRGF